MLVSTLPNLEPSLPIFCSLSCLYSHHLSRILHPLTKAISTTSRPHSIRAYSMPKAKGSKGRKPMKRSWQVIAQEAQDHRDSTIAGVQPLIPEFPQQRPRNVLSLAAMMNPEHEKSIEQVSIKGLLRQLAAGEISAHDITLTFLKRAAIAQSLVSIAHWRYKTKRY